MLVVKIPEMYINEPGILSEAGKYIRRYGQNVLIIAGETAFRKTADILTDSLREWKIDYFFQIMEGYPTDAKVKAYELRADAIIGLGGARPWRTCKKTVRQGWRAVSGITSSAVGEYAEKH